MRTKTQQELIDIIRFEICGVPLPDHFYVSDEASLLSISKKHDLSHLVYDALEKNGICCGNESAMQSYFISIWRAEQMTHEMTSVTDLFEKKHIEFMPLKGSIMRPLYPEPWMRTSADIDILFREEDFDEACKMLNTDLGYAEDERDKASHHLSFRAPKNNVHVEAHRTLFTDFQTDQRVMDQLPSIWSQARPSPEHEYFMCMSDACFYFYHIAHMAKHLNLEGGCPIRSLIDLWILDTLTERDETGRSELLEKAGLLTFARVMSSTAKAWLEGSEVPSEELEQFILTGHMYSDLKNQVSLGLNKSGLRKYILNRVFQPYDVIKYTFPVLQQHRWLTPFFQMVRWAKIFKKEYRDRLRFRAATLMQTAQNEMDQIGHIRQLLGINDTKGT